MNLLTGTIKLDLVRSQFARGRMAAHIHAHEIAEYDCEHISLVPERVLAFFGSIVANPCGWPRATFSIMLQRCESLLWRWPVVSWLIDQVLTIHRPPKL